jgi:CDP-diacylglycerol--glycerol-3-phosphate 3-phosphatidyltransferase
MTFTGTIGAVCTRILNGLVRALVFTRIHPNVFTCVGLAINAVGAWMLSRGEFFEAGLVVLLAAVFDLVDGPIARSSGRVTRFGGFLDSVIDRYSDLILLVGMLVYYASVNRFGYIVLTAEAMTGSVMVSYVRARSENEIPKCKVGFLERPERIVLLIIGTLFNRMTAVLWVIAVLSNLTVVHRIVHTWKETTRIGQSPAEAPAAEGAKAKAGGDLRTGVRST